MSSRPAPQRPATFRDVLASREYRAVFAGSILSWLGDYSARAAVTALVYQRTDSVAASAAAFVISYLPWIGIGSILAAITERRSYRRVMIHSDLIRMLLMALVALPGLPVPAMIGLLFCTALLNPPFDAARSALLPRILDGDRYVVGLALQKSAGQAAQIVGYVGGAGLATYDARIAVLFNALTFGLSALLVGLEVHERPPALSSERQSTILRETLEGFSIVFGTPVLRAIAVLVFIVVFFAIIPEGLAAGWAARLTDVQEDRGWYQGLIMMANPAGFVAGGVLIGRFVAPARRIALIRPLAVLAPVALLISFADPGVYWVAGMSTVCGFAGAGLLPTTNGLFVRALPDEFRARAFAVMQSGVMVLQGVSIFLSGALADRYPLPRVVGVLAALGVVVTAFVAVTFPRAPAIEAAVAAAQRANAAASAAPAGRPGAGGSDTGDPDGPAGEDADVGGAAPRPVADDQMLLRPQNSTS